MRQRLLALAAGAACVLAFAPFAIPLWSIAMLALLFALWSGSGPSARISA